MQIEEHGAIAAFGYRSGVIPPLQTIASTIKAAMQTADDRPVKTTLDGDDVALLDHVGVRVVIGRQQAATEGLCSHLVFAVGNAPDMEGARPNRKTHAKRTDKLASWVKQTMPYDTDLRAETPEAVDAKLVRGFLELLDHAEGMTATQHADASSFILDTAATVDASVIDHDDTLSPKPPRKRARDRFDPEGIIELDDLGDSLPDTPQWLQDQAEPTQPLRLTVHTMALSLMLYSAPLGAFLFTYSMLRDITKGENEEDGQETA